MCDVLDSESNAKWSDLYQMCIQMHKNLSLVFVYLFACSFYFSCVRCSMCSLCLYILITNLQRKRWIRYSCTKTLTHTVAFKAHSKRGSQTDFYISKKTLRVVCLRFFFSLLLLQFDMSLWLLLLCACFELYLLVQYSIYTDVARVRVFVICSLFCFESRSCFVCVLLLFRFLSSFDRSSLSFCYTHRHMINTDWLEMKTT